MAIYINGIGSITAQRINPRATTLVLNKPAGNRLQCVEPDYSGLIPPMQLRRMSKVVRIGIASAKQALQDAGLETPHRISLGTAYGCLADTGQFLEKMIVQEERMLTPTAFIQSTHNTVSGQIALLTACYGHNFTYVHRGHSFESALQETMMYLDETSSDASGKHMTVLVGGMDESTDASHAIITRFGTYKNEYESMDIPSEGTIAGEGSNLFVASNQKKDGSYARVIDVCMARDENVQEQLVHFLEANGLHPEEIDTCLIGLNGDSRYDEHILANAAVLSRARRLGFKRWCGEYPTSSAFAFALACMFLNKTEIPDEMLLSGSPNPAESPRRILIYNHYKLKYHSFILLESI